MLFALLPLFACSDPWAVATVTQVTPEGLQVEVLLDGVSEAELAGQTVHDGDTISIPIEQLKIGLNEFPFEGAKFDSFSRLSHELAPNDSLQPQCGPQETWRMIHGKPEYDYTPRFTASHCGLVGSEMAVPVTLHGQASVHVEGGRVEDSVLYFPLGEQAYDEALSTGSSFGSGRVSYESEIRLSYPDGSSWSQKVEVSSRQSAVSAFFSGLPATLTPLKRSPSEVNTLAVYQAGDHFWATGQTQGRTLGQADLYVQAGKKGPVKDFKTCTFRTLQGGSFSTKATAQSQEFIAYNAAGVEVARRTLEVGGCPASVALGEGETLKLVPGQGQVKAWVDGLL